MDIRVVTLTGMILGARLLCLSQGTESPIDSMFTQIKISSGENYRNAVALLLQEPNVKAFLLDKKQCVSSTTNDVRATSILLAKINFPEVFTEFQSMFRDTCNKYQHERIGVVSGLIIQFTKIGPESRSVEEKMLDKDGKPVFEEILPTNRAVVITRVKPKYRTVEKYTDAEVQAGIARNAAARDAVLEKFSKFFNEGNVFEQRVLLDTVYRLWGSTSHERRKTDPIADDLIEAVYKDVSLPLPVRYTAKIYLPQVKQDAAQSFLLEVVKKGMEEKGSHSEEFFCRALKDMESTADAASLALLKSQTNGPKWKVDRVMEATKKIESRLLLHTIDR
jgi:hypothetical protein